MEMVKMATSVGYYTPSPPGKFSVSDLLRLFLVYSWGEIAKVG